MLSSELEFCLNEAFQKARDARHEYMTVEHLLLSILDAPRVREILKACGADIARLQADLQKFIDETTPALRRGRRPRSAADARLPARAAARGVQRAVERPQGSRGLERAGRDLQREAVACRLPAVAAGRHAARRRQLHFARPALRHRDARGAARGGCARGARGRRGERRVGAREIHDQPECPGAGRARRPADRAPARGAADDRDPVPPAQEQPAVRRRGRVSARPRSPKGSRGWWSNARFRTCSPTARSTRSTWAR